MPKTEIWAGALSLLLHHQETACPHAASQAARLLTSIADARDLDEATRALCDRASIRLSNAGIAKQNTGYDGVDRNTVRFDRPPP